MAAHQTKLNVLGNNIANVNTYGFKSSRVVFSDVLYQNLSTATGATDVTGGTNASQLGYGTKVGSIDMMNTISSGASTGRALDVYIAGEGYLAVQPTAGANRYTRVGNLKFDAEGNLTDGGGSKVMGIPLDADGNPVLNPNGTLAVEELQAINVPPAELEKYTGITIGKSGEITGIRAGDPEFTAAPGFASITANIPATSNYTGKISIETVAGPDVTYTENPDQKIKDEIVAAVVTDLTTIPPTADIIGDITITKSGTAAAPIYTLNCKRKDGTVVSVPNTGSAPPVLAFDLPVNPATPGPPPIPAVIQQVTVDVPSALTFSGTTPYILGTFTADTMDVTATVYDKGGVAYTFTRTMTRATDTSLTLGDPAAPDLLQDITLNFDPAKFFAVGTVTDTTIGAIETGSDKPVTLGYLAIAKFANNDGLLQDGNGYFMESANSGQAIASKAGTNGTGGTQSANLEMSNVDLSQEFTDMIIAQRGFQANSRIITVSDSILEELINLKR